MAKINKFHIDSKEVKKSFYSHNDPLPKKKWPKYRPVHIWSKPYSQSFDSDLDYDLCATCGGKGRYFRKTKPGRSVLVQCRDCDCAAMAV